MATLGLIAALGALVSWTFGDYSIQLTTRKMGNWKAIFFIGLGGFIGLTPFVYKDILIVLGDGKQLALFLLLAFITLLTALILFEALKKGKLSIIEPVFGLELIAVVILSIIIGGEHLDTVFYILSGIVFLGLTLSVTQIEKFRFKKDWLEKGVVLAIVGSLLMGFTDFLTGYSSRVSSPLITIWFVHVSIGLMAFIYLVAKGEARNLFSDIKKFPKTILSVMFFDNFAWVCYGYAMVFLPISIATTITESYIALTILIGIYVNKEKVQKHQIAGIVIVVISVLILAYLVEA